MFTELKRKHTQKEGEKHLFFKSYTNSNRYLTILHSHLGPDSWHVHYKYCAGERQSPIDILPLTCEYDPGLEPFILDNFDYTSARTGPCVLNVTNNGHAGGLKSFAFYFLFLSAPVVSLDKRIMGRLDKRIMGRLATDNE